MSGIELLSAVAVRNAKADSTKATALYDGGGLRLLISPNGRKHWQFRFTANGKESSIQLGAFPDMSLSEARNAASSLRKQKKDGANLVQVRKLATIQAKACTDNTFAAVWEDLLAAKIKNGAAPSFIKKIKQAVNANLLPRLGDLPITEISAPILRVALQPMEDRGALDLLSFTRRVAGEVFDLAKATARYAGDNPAHSLRKNIFAKSVEEHRKALPWADMPAFLRALDNIKAARAETVIAVRLLIYTALRPGELVAAQWAEFDLDGALWTVPAERMKRRQLHKVPLATQAVEMLRQLDAINGKGRYLFPAFHGSTIGHVTTAGLLKVARKCNGEIDNHGFRATFRTHAEETGKWRHEVMEAYLAHAKANAIVGAYDRATHRKERAKLAQWYADELEKAGQSKAKQ